MTPFEIITAVALWCSTPGTSMKALDVEDVNICREKLVHCVEKAPKEKQAQCFKMTKLQ